MEQEKPATHQADQFREITSGVYPGRWPHQRLPPVPGKFLKEVELTEHSANQLRDIGSGYIRVDSQARDCRRFRSS